MSAFNWASLGLDAISIAIVLVLLGLALANNVIGVPNKKFGIFVSGLMSTILFTLVLAVVLATSGCKTRGPTEFRGIPPNVHIACAAASGGGPTTCIGGGIAYVCISHWDTGSSGGTLFECAPAGPQVQSETPQ